ncbi:hypothetical protein [Haliscomenobacter hydrossis]|uniref:Uncharacterized protein n=1 Tax=Haliscomenobacter hydrossis (strain ATCC 27775 / DSM 1100 / LMG 10767 / O) TaxID=760192 RepID=F4KZJ8_HALH1|nr:hypothetical protein [Haliscomenobacter hydrossis]AEE49468.1 hypothetical protein Halhy_1576 [Haliscomenobacter hydrossis DSM 1100]
MIYFTDIFEADESKLNAYGAFNISLINDLPLFIDPFLLFGSSKNEYQHLHEDILRYIAFLKERSNGGDIPMSQIIAWYVFPEIKQNWLGYSLVGNRGSGLGKKFGKSFSSSLDFLFKDIGNETISVTSHIEKTCLFEVGIGRDNISDLTCNLIKNYLLEYTQKFSLENIDPKYLASVKVEKVYFDYTLERWMPGTFTLPVLDADYVLLTPKDILTKDDNWINRGDLNAKFNEIYSAIPNSQLRFEIENYFKQNLPAPTPNKSLSDKEKNEAISRVLRKYPEIIDYFIKYKETNKEGARRISNEKVDEVYNLFIKNTSRFIELLKNETPFYAISHINSYSEAMKRVEFMKTVIEDMDGYRLFYHKGAPIKREADLQIIYRLTWYATDYDVNREVNNGRGPVDYTISKGSKDKTLVEFKLASNSQLKKNLLNQVEIYKKANKTESSIKVILYFDDSEYRKVVSILKELNLSEDKSIILIDAGADNKVSASKATEH